MSKLQQAHHGFFKLDTKTTVSEQLEKENSKSKKSCELNIFQNELIKREYNMNTNDNQNEIIRTWKNYNEN
jgi:hypothetical protein